MDNSKISILFKLLYLIKFVSKQEMKEYLEIIIKDTIDNGKVEGLILTGNTRSSVKILENYINKSDDLLVTYILAKFFVEHSERFYKTCENDLFEVLNRLKMFNQRIFLNQKLNELYATLMSRALNTPLNKNRKNNQNEAVEFVLNCFYCNIKIQADKADQFKMYLTNHKEPNEMVSGILFFIFKLYK